MEAEELYLVRIDASGKFVSGIDERVVDVTYVPSAAQFFCYADACKLVARLRKRGYPGSVVTDLAGMAMDFRRLQMITTDEARAKKFWGEQ